MSIKINLADPDLELIDPTPNVCLLFIQFDKLFFWSKLASRVVVRWSKRMYSCAGICSYEGRGGLCDIALSEPLLKLRPRKDLVETLLHEMIHAYLFVTCRVQDRDGHGPNFKAHMYRINKLASLNISVYHDFHDEVNLYKSHWWRCNGPCQSRKPYFGTVRRSTNRAPGPSDYWWEYHRRNCGGTFIKIKEPEKKTNKNVAAKPKLNEITQYINNNNSTLVNRNKQQNPSKTTIKATNISAKSNGDNIVVTRKDTTFSPQVSKTTGFNGKGHTINGARSRTNSVGVIETVRNVWANKQIQINSTKTAVTVKNPMSNSYSNTQNTNKHKANSHSNSPPGKIKKIDDYFKKTATSMLKDIYGNEFKITQSNNTNKLIAVSAVDTSKHLVDCPVCSSKIDSEQINRHLDECLNKDVIEKLSKGEVNNIDIVASKQKNYKSYLKNIVGDLPKTPPFEANSKNLDDIAVSKETIDKRNLKDILGDLSEIPPFKGKSVNPGDCDNILHNKKIDSKNYLFSSVSVDLKSLSSSRGENTKPANLTNNFDSKDINKVKSIVKKINYDKYIRRSDNFIVPKEENKETDVGFLPSFLDDIACDIKIPPIKLEPGTSTDVISKLTEPKCPCCGEIINKTMAEHLDECLAFFDNNTTIPEEGASTSFANQTIVIDDDEDDIFDESLTLNATGTKHPCPSCLNMIEQTLMNEHLDECLS